MTAPHLKRGNRGRETGDRRAVISLMSQSRKNVPSVPMFPVCPHVSPMFPHVSNDSLVRDPNALESP
jgi:hypothetical protein